MGRHWTRTPTPVKPRGAAVRAPCSRARAHAHAHPQLADAAEPTRPPAPHLARAPRRALDPRASPGATHVHARVSSASAYCAFAAAFTRS